MRTRFLLLAVFAASIAPVAAAGPPPIRTTGGNVVPGCVTPERLMTFLRVRNPDLDRRYDRIAGWYRQHGDAWRVRWDYAFFQMTLETNFLMYRRGDGRPGDVHPSQNNFAGLGTTGGGVPGDRFPDVATGVLGQIQHLVAYSGERLADPIAPRTRLKQDDIIHVSKRLGRPVTFADLARRWAVDKEYGRSIEWVATQFRNTHCNQPEISPPAPAMASRPNQNKPLPWAVAATVVPPAASAQTATADTPAPAPSRCVITAASYGGRTTLLIQSSAGDTIQFTALTVQDGFEQSMARSYIAAYAPGGASIGSYPSLPAALAKARELCPSA